MNNQSATMNTKDNPLGYKKESALLVGFAIPCIISMLVTALYNIVDQILDRKSTRLNSSHSH